MKALIAKKLGMTSNISKDGTVEAITLLLASPCTITQIKNLDDDGYTAVQLGFDMAKKISKPQLGHFKKSKASPKHVKEFRFDELPQDIKVGDKIELTQFEEGDLVHVSGISKGKGFAGTIKRHNFHTGRKTHGGRSYRRPGSIGSMYPQKVFKGKKMAGQMGHTKVSVRNLKVTLIDSENSVIGIKGAIPGPKRGVIILRGAE